MSYENIGRRWARAVFEIGKESGNVSRLEADLAAFAAASAGNEELAAVLDNPLVPEGSRDAIISELGARMGLSDAARSTLRLLAKKRRLAALPDIARQLARLVRRGRRRRPRRGDQRRAPRRRLPRQAPRRAGEGDGQEGRHHPQAGQVARSAAW